MISTPKIGYGVYTVSDASLILNLHRSKLKKWISGYWDESSIWGDSKDIGFNFYILIEIFTVMSLRELGVTFKKITEAKFELMKIYKTDFPFAFETLMSDGKNILSSFEQRELLELDKSRQIAFKHIIEPFCEKIDFDRQEELASRFWPLGKDSSIVVDPKHGFGRPTISGTNIITEVINNLIRAGETYNTIANLYQITEKQVEEVNRFENRLAA